MESEYILQIPLGHRGLPSHSVTPSWNHEEHRLTFDALDQGDVQERDTQGNTRESEIVKPERQTELGRWG